MMAKELTNLYQVGKSEGKIEGKKERDVEIAEMMLKANEEIDKIIKYTQLSKEQIEDIKKQVQH
jgi:predicted transposase/invertase (TIGR01784 family)